MTESQFTSAGQLFWRGTAATTRVHHPLTSPSDEEVGRLPAAAFDTRGSAVGIKALTGQLFSRARKIERRSREDLLANVIGIRHLASAADTRYRAKYTDPNRSSEHVAPPSSRPEWLPCVQDPQVHPESAGHDQSVNYLLVSCRGAVESRCSGRGCAPPPNGKALC